MRPLPTVTAMALASLSFALVPSSASAGAEPPAVSAGWDKNDALIARFADSSQRAGALKEIKALGKKAKGKLRIYLMQQVGSENSDLAEAAIEAVLAVGKPMTKSLKTALDTGEYKGAAIPRRRATRVALMVDPAGKRTLLPHLESHALSPVIASAILAFADPTTAFRIFAQEAAKDESRSIALVGLRALRGHEDFQDTAEANALMQDATKGLEDPIKQILMDAFTIADVGRDRERMEAWIQSGDLVRCESALWSIGGVGQAFMGLAPLVEQHLMAEHLAVRHAAHWALRRFTSTEPGHSDILDSVATGAPTVVSKSEKVRRHQDLYRSLCQAEMGVLRPATDGDDAATEPQGPLVLGESSAGHWSFAPNWISTLGDTFTDKHFGAATPGWNRSSLPSAIVDIVPSLEAALLGDDRDAATQAGLTLIEWNAVTKQLLEWAVKALATEENHQTLRPIWSLLVRECEHPWLRQKPALEGLRTALQDGPARMQSVRLLSTMDTRATQKLLMAYFEGASPQDPWHPEQYLSLYSLMVNHRDARPRFAGVLSERLVAGDFRVAPLLVLGGSTSHAALTTALSSPLVDVRMVAVAVLVEQGRTARPMVSIIEGLTESEPHALKFREDSLAAIAANQ